MTAVRPGVWSRTPTHSCATLRPPLAATARTSSTARRWLPKACTGIVLVRAAPVAGRKRLVRVHVPNSRPRKSGEYEMTPMPCSAHHGSTSSSPPAAGCCTAADRNGAARRSRATRRAVPRRSSTRRSPESCRPSAARRTRARSRRSAAARASAAETDRCVDAETPQAGVALGDHVGAAVGDRVGVSLLMPRPNFVKTMGRRDDGNCFSARPTTFSECPDP